MFEYRSLFCPPLGWLLLIQTVWMNNTVKGFDMAGERVSALQGHGTCRQGFFPLKAFFQFDVLRFLKSRQADAQVSIGGPDRCFKIGEAGFFNAYKNGHDG